MADRISAPHIIEAAGLEGRIIKGAEYGQQIALTCVNHPDKRWSTKNISPIGCRRIFWNLFNEGGMGQECDCELSDLRPVDQ